MQGSIIEKPQTQDKEVRAQSSLSKKILNVCLLKKYFIAGLCVTHTRFRLVIASFLTTALGIAVYLFFKHLIPGNEVFPEYIVAIGIGLIGIAFMARRGYVG